MQLVANLAIRKRRKTTEMTKTLVHGYSETTQQELFNECRHERV